MSVDINETGGDASHPPAPGTEIVIRLVADGERIRFFEPENDDAWVSAATAVALSEAQ